MLGKLIDKLRKGLTKTREGMVQKIREVLRRRPEIDEETLEEIEEILIEADVGVEPTLRIIDQLRERFETGEPIENPETAVQEFLEEEIRKILLPSDTAPSIAITAKPHVILVVGVNGVGKTTTIGKMAYKLSREGKKVLFAAGDTFRAAAIDQLGIWADRTGSDIVQHQPGADAASVAFDAIQAASARDIDVVIIDTAGRLHTKINLMEEVKKIRRVVAKAHARCPPRNPARTRCNNRTKRRHTGKAISQRSRTHGPCPGKTRRHGQRGCRRRHSRRTRPTRALCRPGRRH